MCSEWDVSYTHHLFQLPFAPLWIHRTGCYTLGNNILMMILEAVRSLTGAVAKMTTVRGDNLWCTFRCVTQLLLLTP